MTGLYLAALLVSIGCELLIDRRLRLFWWRDPRSAAITLAAGLTFFLVWDLLAIGQGIFGIGDNDLMLGIELAPHLPIEEPFFLVLLIQTAMICYGIARRQVSR